MKTNVNELITALEKLNPIVFADLKNKKDSVVIKGVTLGNDIASDKDLLYKSEICLKTNIEVIKKCDFEFPKIKHRIVFHKKLSLISQIITTISSATVITTLVSNPDNKFIILIFGIFSLLGSLIPPINEYIVTGLNTKKINESFEELVSNKISIENLNKELDYVLYSKKVDAQKISEIINECNQKTALINRLLILV